MKTSRKQYSKEFKKEAVRLSVSSGKPVTQVARELGISVYVLGDWRRLARLEHELPAAENETPDQELKRLRRENRLLEQERDILKKAIAYFAQPAK